MLILPSTVANVLDCDIEVNELESQSCYYVHFQTNTFEKGMNTLYSLSNGLTLSSTFLLQKWLARR